MGTGVVDGEEGGPVTDSTCTPPLVLLFLEGDVVSCPSEERTTPDGPLPVLADPDPSRTRLFESRVPPGPESRPDPTVRRPWVRAHPPPPPLPVSYPGPIPCFSICSCPGH